MIFLNQPHHPPSRRITIDRRVFLGSALSAALTISLRGGVAHAQTAARIVIVGAGSGGATLANYLRRLAPSIAVTLVERNPQLTTGTFSNHVFAGLRRIDQITHAYDQLKARGVTLVQGVAADVDTTARTLALIDGTKIPYDRLVLAPGIDFNTSQIDGYTEETSKLIPHGWRGASQTALLKAQLDALPDGGTVVMTIPPEPMSCAPAAYERACLIAYALKTQKARCKLIVLDANASFPLQDIFKAAFKIYYSNVLEYVGSSPTASFDIAAINTSSRLVTTKSGLGFRAGVVNLIPPQMAGAIAQRAGCTENGWCPVESASFASKIVKNVHVIGDCAQSAELPKTAFAANNQAKALAAHLADALAGRPTGAVNLRDAGWWFVTPTDCVKSGAAYPLSATPTAKPYTPVDRYASQLADDLAERRGNVDEAEGWYAGITADMLGSAG
jgi:sulfide dehydrogenase [flavocytochrome c] flavoprotein chain